MIPASFAPFIMKMIAPKLTESIVEHIAKIFKLNHLVDYMELPNDADKRIDKLETQIVMLDKDQHPPAIDLEEWEQIKKDINKIKKLRAFKSIGE